MKKINIKNLTVSFGKKTVLDKISFSMSQGITVLSGQSGAGKTTLLNCIANIYNDYKGTIELIDVNKLQYCPQDNLYFNNLTVYENMFIKAVASFQDQETKNFKIINETLRLFGIEGLAECKVGTLSGGECQRLKMAMVAMTSPDVILLDEPICNLDDYNKEKVADIIENVWSQALVLIVSHDDIPFKKNVCKLRLQEGKILQ